MNLKKTILLAVVILVLDQWSKIFIKTHFTYQEEIEVFSWFKIFFIENRGAAWGTQLSDFLPISERSAKFGLTLFRLFAIVGIAIWGYRSALKKAPSLLSKTKLDWASSFLAILSCSINTPIYLLTPNATPT